MKFSLALLVAANAANSGGCNKALNVNSGSSALSGSLAGTSRTWRIYVPKSYSSSKAVPLVVSTHGWGGDGREEERYTGLNAQADQQGFIAVYPDGYSDNGSRGGWGSWNCVGSTQSTPQKKTCNVNLPSYCYESCNGCGQGLGCDWTTCKNDVTPTGIGKSNVNGFLPSLYDYMEDNFCIDTTREFHSGMSNGAMMTYQMGVSMGSRLAAIAPVAGSMHRGFNDTPNSCVPILNLIGTNDRAVPPGPTTLSNDGWYYTPFETLLGDWAPKCGGSSSKKSTYSTPYGSQNGLKCNSYGTSQVVGCTWTGGHTWPSFNGGLVWYFFNQHSNAKHLGHGLTTDMDPADHVRSEQFTNVQVLPVHTSITTEDKFRGMPLEMKANATDGVRTHYGNPAHKCRKDEDILSLPGGAVCAPKISHTFETVDGEARPKPACHLGGQEYDSQSGCPNDTPGNIRGSALAFPTCLGLDSKSFHCVLTCGPCREGDSDCTAAADDACPSGAKCVVGLNRQQHYGTCMYPSKYDANLGNSTLGVVNA